MNQINNSQTHPKSAQQPAPRLAIVTRRPWQTPRVRAQSVAVRFLLLSGLFFMVQVNYCCAQKINSRNGNADSRQALAAKTKPTQEAEFRLAQDVFRKVNEASNAPFSPPVRSEMNRLKTVGTHLRSFGIPFQINADNDAFIEVQLYLSRDLGSSWKFAGRQTTDRKDFPFESTEDGEYWFSMKTLDRDRRLLPEGDPQPELKIIVDTVKPTLDFQVEADAAGRVVCRWTAKDKNLRPESLQIFYQNALQANSSNSWKRVPVNLNGRQRAGVYSDQIAWWPETAERQLRVAVEIKDIAGNTVQVDRRLTIQPAIWRHSSESTAQITDRSQPSRDVAIAQSRQPADRSQSPPVDSYTTTQFRSPLDHFKTAASETKSQTRPSQPAPRSFSPPLGTNNSTAPGAAIAQKTNSIVWESEIKREFTRNQTSVATALPRSFPLNSQPAAQSTPRQLLARPSLEAPPNASTTKISKGLFIGESSTMGATNQYRGPRTGNEQPITAPTLVPAVSRQQPAVPPADGQYSTQLLPALPPITSKENLTTTLKPTSDLDQANPYLGDLVRAGSPNNLSIRQSAPPTTVVKKPSMNMEDQVIGSMRFDLQYAIDAIDPSGVDRVILWGTRDGVQWKSWASDPDSQSPFPVSVDQNGTFGFRIVVHSKDGLTGIGPSTGDPADIWITVDTEKPVTRINSVPYGRGREAGQLVINYTVADPELTLRPITLAYSSTRSGPWSIIDENLSNEGQHLWKPGTDVPKKIFLRIEARDKAGNVGIHLLQQPIDISGLVPSGTISGVSAVGKN